MAERILIIGGGPAGYSAAIYAARSGMQALLLEGMLPGGQLTTTTMISNYPGFSEGVDANTLMAEMRSQAVNLGADVRSGTVVSVDFSSRPFRVVTDSAEQIVSDCVVVASGASARYLGLPSEMAFKGRGVSACATCDGFFYRKKVVAVVGGGDTACEEASYLAGLCSKVYMIVRRDVLRASEAMQKRVLENEKIEILWNCSTRELLGDDAGLTSAVISRKDSEDFKIDIDGFFLAIGHTPNTDFLNGALELDSEGYILTDGWSSRTSVPGVFAAGDVRDPVYRQGIVAAASGAMASMDARKWLDLNK